MKKYKFFKEDLNLLSQENDTSPAVQQANQLKLNHVGFGRYEDPETGQVSHIIQNDKLTPFAQAVKTNEYASLNGDDFGNFAKGIQPQVEQVNEALIQTYPPELFDADELNTIKVFVTDQYYDVNAVLSTLPTGVAAEKVQPHDAQDQTPYLVALMDRVVTKKPTPIPFYAYTTLSPEIDPSTIQPGMAFTFKGYRSTTIHIGFALNNNFVNQVQPTIVLQILVDKGNPGVYVEDYTTNPGEGEFILPRATTIQIVDGPNKVVGSSAAAKQDNIPVLFYNCEIVR